MAPTYPSQSRRLGETGVAILRLELKDTGRVDSATVKASSSHSRLDEAAL
ncbi:MAG: energy transducer TonB [Azonexus sp.]|nr:energy transducer TonB [Azonexus sp.]